MRPGAPIAAGVAFAALAACTANDGAGANAPAPAAVTLTEADAGSTRTVARGSPIELRLPAQLGTGYSWRRTDTTAIASMGEPVTETASRQPGAAETQLFRLRAGTAGTHTLRFVYEQPFAGGEKNARSVEFTLDVR